MEITEIIKTLEMLQGLSNKTETGSPYIGKHVLIRTYSAGVHFGVLKSKDGQNAILENARRLWSWSGAFTLNKVAVDGVESAKIPVAVPELSLEQVIEIIPLSDKARIQLSEYPAHE